MIKYRFRSAHVTSSVPVERLHHPARAGQVEAYQNVAARARVHAVVGCGLRATHAKTRRPAEHGDGLDARPDASDSPASTLTSHHTTWRHASTHAVAWCLPARLAPAGPAVVDVVCDHEASAARPCRDHHPALTA